jgi:adenosine deaminase
MNALPSARKQTELHRHIDVSVRLATLLELAQKAGLEGESTSLEAFGEKVYLREPLTDLPSVLTRFQLFQKVLLTPEILERVGFEASEDCWNEGTKRVEFRFSPGFVCEFSGLPWRDALLAFDRGLARAKARYPGLEAGLLLIASRDYGPEAAEKTMDLALAHREQVLGVDLAGNEVDYPTRLFTQAFQRAAREGLKITVHAGESTGPEEIWLAIEDLKARRIGHGIRAIQDPSLMKALKERGICLEVCPTSNYLTRCVPSLEAHPLPQLLRAGVPVCINTDDPGVFPVTLPSEMELARTRLGMTPTEIETCLSYAEKFSFFS